LSVMILRKRQSHLVPELALAHPTGFVLARLVWEPIFRLAPRHHWIVRRIADDNALRAGQLSKKHCGIWKLGAKKAVFLVWSNVGGC